MNNTISKNQAKKLTRKQKQARAIIFSVIAITVVHAIYMNVMGFNSLSHDACVVYQSVPKWFFYLYENILELFIVVCLGVFAGVIMEQYFYKIKRFYPQNQILAFVYASILPICSCGVIPLIDSMKQRTSIKVVITFILAAPLLNPYIILVSFSVMGVQYAITRIVTSFILAILGGIIFEFIAKKMGVTQLGEYKACATSCKPILDRDPFVKTMAHVKRLGWYIAIAGLLSFAFQFFDPKQYLEYLPLHVEPLTLILMTIVGIPIYVCNGADVLFLKPLVAYADLSMGSAMAFSLTSSVICIASITMLFKFIGKTLTFVLMGIVALLTILMGISINAIF